MGNNQNEHLVIAKRCEEYDRTRIQQIVSEGMAQLGYHPKGKILVKPNVVFANEPAIFGNTAHTPAPFVGAALKAILAHPEVTRVDVGENCAVGLPTRGCYKYAGYYDEIEAVRKAAPRPLDIFCMDEELRDPVFVGGKVHDTLRISRKMARADSLVYLPKLKCHCVSNMTGAVKLNIGICSDDERSIRHDFLLNEKIVDLLAVGYPDLVIMDAIDVGVGNEAFPSIRKLGLILMGTNPLALDLVGARLLGYAIEDVPYLKAAVERGYAPSDIGAVSIGGDLESLAEIDAAAKRILPYDEEFYRWQDVERELQRLKSPMKFYWGPYRHGKGEKCLTGCVMGLKMFLGAMEKFSGPTSFATAKPVSFVIGKYDGMIDARGADVFLLGSCAKADITNAKKVVHIDKCFTTAGDMNISIAHRLGMKAPTRSFRFMREHIRDTAQASFRKTVSGRYAQDIGHFITKGLIRRV